MKNLFGFIVLLLLCESSMGQSQFTNNGAIKLHAGGTMAFYGDFINNSTFTDTGQMIYFNGIVAQNIGGTSITTLHHLTINNSSVTGVSISKSMNVDGSLSMLSGLLNTSSSNILIMIQGATATAGNSLSLSYVNGPMKYQKSGIGVSTLNFPIGKDSDCRPLSLVVNHTDTNTYYYQSESWNASAKGLAYSLPATIDKVSRVHYWTIQRTDLSGSTQSSAQLSGNQTIQIFFGTNDDVMDGNTLKICKNTESNPTTWYDIGGTGGPTYNGVAQAGSVTSTSSPTGFSSFSTFTLADNSGGLNPLPLELLNFTGRCENQNVVLKWSTGSETNTEYFLIERGSDTIHWQIAGSIIAANNSSRTINYSFTDLKNLDAVSYYKLKQTDLDGIQKSFHVITVRNCKKEIIESDLYPNPANDRVMLDYNIPEGMSGLFRVYSMTGGIVGSQNLWEGKRTMNFHTESLNTGIYFYDFVLNDENIKHGKFVITR